VWPLAYMCRIQASCFCWFQLMKFAELYLKANNLASASALQASDIGNMGHFVCGLTADQINTIPNAVYG
jgi:hypothetical protein